MAEGIEVARAYVTIIPKSDGTSNEVINQIVAPMGKGADQAGIMAGKSFNAGLGGVLSKFVVPAAVTAGLVGVGKAGFKAYAEVETGANNVIKATGATGEAAEQLKGVYKDVASSVAGDFGDIGSAVGEINTRLGLTGGELETASEEMMKYAKVTGQDATQATKDVASMMRNAGIPTGELGDTLGKLTVAGQAAGIDVAKLAQNTTKYNAVMKQMGFTTDEQIALMAKFEQSGADTSSILNAMKKGVASWAKDGKDASVEFANFVQGVQDGSLTAGDAVEIFGAKGGLSMYEAAQKGQLDFQDMFAAISNASSENLDTVYNDTLTASEKMGLAWQNVKLAGADIFAPLAVGISNALSNVVLPAVQAARDFISGAMATLSGLYDTYISPAVDQVKASLMPVLEELKPVIQDIGSIVMTVARTVLSVVMPIIGKVISTVAPVATTILRTISPVLTRIVSVVRTAVNTVKTVINGITSVIGSVRGTFNSIKEAMTGPINKAKELINSAVDTIKGFFPLSIGKIFSNLKLPHISVSGGSAPFGIGGKGSLPKFSVNWYAKAEKQPYIFREATLFGAGDNRHHDEMLYSRNSLLNDIEEASGGKGEITVNNNYYGDEDGNDISRDFIRNIKRYKMAGVI